MAVHPKRCTWVTGYPLETAYHDTEWGVPVHDDRVHFEFVVLEGAQAGLSWLTILKKREGYRAAFKGFDPAVVAKFTEKEVAALRENSSIVRNRLKIRAAITNAARFLVVQREFGSFDRFIWQFMGGVPRANWYRSLEEIPAQTVESRAMSKALKKRGFSFVGPTICYAYMQATGMVNDHETSCFRHAEIRSLTAGHSRFDR